MTEIHGYYITHIFQEQQLFNTYIGQHRNSPTTVMIKTYDIKNKSQEEIQQLLTTIELQQNLKCSFILPVLKVYRFKNYILTIHPFCEYGAMEQQIGERWQQNNQLKQQQIQYYLTQILLGLKVIKDAGIICNTITTQNIYIKKSKKYKNGQIQLDCFTNCVKSQNSQEISQELIYSSFQMLSGQQYTYKSNIFNIGVIIYNMMTKYFPFTGKTQERLIKQQLNNHIRRITERCYTDELKQLVYNMLQKDENNRPEIEDMLQSDLCTPFLKIFNYQMNQNGQYVLKSKLIECDTKESTKSE